MKTKTCASTPMSTLTRGGDGWGGSNDDIRMIGIFQNKVIHCMLGMTMTQAKEEEASNDKVRRRLGNVPKVVDA